ncbi:MAG: M48 family metallopeptidase [Candidatus Saccharimonas sp.]
MQEAGATKGQLAVKRAYSSSDIGVLVATFIVFFLISSGYFIISYFIDISQESIGAVEIILGLIGVAIGGAFLFVLIILTGMFILKMQRQMMLGNALQVEYSAYAWLRDWANEVAVDIAIPKVEIFITQDPVINAYAFGFIRPYTIVLHSGTIRYMTKEEIQMVVLHEMAHVKYGHTVASLYFVPFMNIPVLGIFFTWLAGFWQRRAELTADRLALMYLGDSELVKQALIKVHVGPDVASSMNEVARQWQQYVAERPFNRFTQTFSSHPFLVRRISHVDKWKSLVESPTNVATQPAE